LRSLRNAFHRRVMRFILGGTRGSGARPWRSGESVEDRKPEAVVIRQSGRSR
jgi:hypothetical protein